MNAEARYVKSDFFENNYIALDIYSLELATNVKGFVEDLIDRETENANYDMAFEYGLIRKELTIAIKEMKENKDDTVKED